MSCIIRVFFIVSLANKVRLIEIYLLLMTTNFYRITTIVIRMLKYYMVNRVIVVVLITKKIHILFDWRMTELIL